MTTQLAALWTLLGLLAIAGVLFLLQRLRVRQRSLTVETTLFWRQAVQETRARVLVQRFRHPWAYALLLLIAALLWLSFAGLDLRRGDARQTVVLLDGSAGMARGDRFAATVALVEELVGGLPAASRTVVLCGGEPRTVLRPKEHRRLLRERLQGAVPEACPATVMAALRDRLVPGGRGALRIVVAGDAPVAQRELDRLPAGVTVERLAPPGAAPGANQGITALGVSPAASGAWEKVDLLVEVASTGAEVAVPALRLADAATTLRPSAQERTATGPMRLVYRDLPAQGQLVDVALAGDDALGLDDSASIVLPQRRRLRVAIEPGLPEVLTAVVQADPALILVEESAQVVLRSSGSRFGAALPALEFVPEAEQKDAFTISCAADQDPEAVILRLYDRLGLGEIDAADVARRTGKVISMGAAAGQQANAPRGIKVWRSLLSPEFNFVQSRSFPLFVALSLRWVAGAWTPPESFAVGEPVDLDDVELEDPRQRAVASLGDSFTPTSPGVHALANGQRVAAALLDPDTSVPPVSSAALAVAAVGGGGLDFATLLLLIALLLLAAEWFLLQTGRLP